MGPGFLVQKPIRSTTCGGKRVPGDPLRRIRAAHQHKAGAQAVQKPGRIKGGDVGAHPGLEDHGKRPFFEMTGEMTGKAESTGPAGCRFCAACRCPQMAGRALLPAASSPLPQASPAGINARPTIPPGAPACFLPFVCRQALRAAQHAPSGRTPVQGAMPASSRHPGGRLALKAPLGKGCGIGVPCGGAPGGHFCAQMGSFSTHSPYSFLSNRSGL